MHHKLLRDISVSLCFLFSIFSLAGCDFFDDHSDFFSTTLTARIISPTESTVTINAGESVNFQGEITGGQKPYYISWNFAGAADNSTVLSPGNITFDDPGMYTVVFHVFDTGGFEKQDTCVVKVNTIGGDFISVTSITPSTDVTPDVSTPFIVTLDYTLNSVAQGELSIAFNTDAENYYAFVPVALDSSGIVARGSGTRTYEVTCTPLNWVDTGSFQVLAALYEYPHDDTSTPLVTDTEVIGVKNE